MANPVDYAISHARLTLSVLIFLLITGAISYIAIPKEAEPDVKVPIIYVNVTQRGISPEDAERLILRPLETQLKGINHIKEMRSAAYEGGGYVLIEFEAGFNSEAALADVRAKVDVSKSELPHDAEEPRIQEINLSLFPVIVVALGGNVPERTLLKLARETKTAIEQISGVLTADLRGARDESIEIIAKPMLMKSYGIMLDNLSQSFTSGNTLIAAGALEGVSGRFAVKVPSLIEKPEDILTFPVTATGSVSITLGDIAEIRPTFKDPTSITRINGRPAITVEVIKRTGANLIETVDTVKKVVTELQGSWPETVEVIFTQDKSTDIRSMLHELQNSVITAVLLVIIIMLLALGGRASIFIGIAIPASFLTGILGLHLAGLTVNIVVLFSLILAVGMLVDDAIIVSEFAERRMIEGMPPKMAYSLAAKRMAGPVISATLTRIAAFSPLMFWPGIVGEFMKYLPLTLIATLAASMVVALFFTPTLGALLGAPQHLHKEKIENDSLYIRIVKHALRHPGRTLSLAGALLVSVIFIYGRFGNGVEFFPSVEPDYGLVQVRARGNLSITEKDQIVREIEEHLARMPELKTIYARAGEGQKGSSEITDDTIGTIQFEFINWRNRRKAQAILTEIRKRAADIPGIIVEVTEPRAGPPTGKPITLEISGMDQEEIFRAARIAATLLHHRPDVLDIDDGLPLPGIDWKLAVDKAEAAKYGISPLIIGTAVQLITNGVKLAEYRPSDTDKSVDILLRFPDSRRNLNELDNLHINTRNGAVPISNFVARSAEPRIGLINRVDGQRVINVTANIVEGIQSSAVQKEIMEELARADLPPGIAYRMKGEDEEREKASAFLINAFGSAIFLIFAVLLAQFNKFSSVLLVLSAVLLSTIGVLVGLLFMGQAFGVVMTGIGVIANAGVIVNNNIVLIDTYDRLRREGTLTYDAILETCRERARPVVLTAVTALLGVLAIAFGINIDFAARSIDIGAPSTQWWTHLATAIVFGLGFATILTLIVTPAALMGLANIEERLGKRHNRKSAKAP